MHWAKKVSKVKRTKISKEIIKQKDKWQISLKSNLRNRGNILKYSIEKIMVYFY